LNICSGLQYGIALKEGPQRRSKIFMRTHVIGAAGVVRTQPSKYFFPADVHADHPGRAGSGATAPPSGGEYASPVKPIFNP
jgi:hypothetical protein